MSNRSVPERFWAKVDKSAECWIWKGARGSNQYGAFRFDGKLQRAHRVSYMLHVGPIPNGMEIDHLCNVPPCVRPEHLRLVTPKQNQENKHGLARNNTSGVRGVYWNARSGKWRALVSHHNRRVDLGMFSDLGDAAEAVRLARLELHTHNDEDRAPSRP